MDSDFHYNSEEFREAVYNEIRTKYLSTNNTMYDPLMVIIGIRLKIEEDIFHSLQVNQQREFLETHKVINKLVFAEKKELIFQNYTIYCNLCIMMVCILEKMIN